MSPDELFKFISSTLIYNPTEVSFKLALRDAVVLLTITYYEF